MKRERPNGRSTRSPRTTEEQDTPEPERLLNTQEERGEALQEMEDPPQAEGDRDE